MGRYSPINGDKFAASESATVQGHDMVWHGGAWILDNLYFGSTKTCNPTSHSVGEGHFLKVWVAHRTYEAAACRSSWGYHPRGTNNSPAREHLFKFSLKDPEDAKPQSQWATQQVGTKRKPIEVWNGWSPSTLNPRMNHALYFKTFRWYWHGVDIIPIIPIVECLSYLFFVYPIELGPHKVVYKTGS